MQIIKISISNSSIFEEISLASAYAGAKKDDEKGFYDRVATVNADETLLNRFVTEMHGVVADRFREFLTSTECGEEALGFTLEVSGSYDNSLTPSVKEDIFRGIVAGVISRWFRFTFPSQEETYRIQTDRFLERAYAKLCQRRKPRRQQPVIPTTSTISTMQTTTTNNEKNNQS